MHDVVWSLYLEQPQNVYFSHCKLVDGKMRKGETVRKTTEKNKKNEWFAFYSFKKDKGASAANNASRLVSSSGVQGILDSDSISRIKHSELKPTPPYIHLHGCTAQSAKVVEQAASWKKGSIWRRKE